MSNILAKHRYFINDKPVSASYFKVMKIIKDECSKLDSCRYCDFETLCIGHKGIPKDLKLRIDVEDDNEALEGFKNFMNEMKKTRGFEIVDDKFRKFPNIDVKLPQRGTSQAMAYDFYSNEDVIIHPKEQYVFVTDIKAYMQPGEALMGNVRSSQGIKMNLSFANSQAWIDMDFYSNADNDGNISICLYNYGDKPQKINIGDRIAQFAFIPFLVADNGNTEVKRNGGIGSTGV